MDLDYISSERCKPQHFACQRVSRKEEPKLSFRTRASDRECANMEAAYLIADLT